MCRNRDAAVCGREDQKGQDEEPVHRVHARRPPLSGGRRAREVPASEGEDKETDDEGRRRRKKEGPIVVHGHETVEGEHAHQVQLHHLRGRGSRRAIHRKTRGRTLAHSIIVWNASGKVTMGKLQGRALRIW